ncbi:MAG: type-F conjugative transfer system pilin assembly protein TraF [Proteobacteria bacterium]|nr:type-F conjugative transfer system pilin assembly protein TraF [Pseudomonadota bacterium]
MKLLIITLFLLNHCFGDGFFNTHSKGWHWYEKIIEEEDELKKDVKKEDQKQKPMTPSETVKAYSKELENRLHKAWINPTGENIKSYMEMQKDMVDRSETFSKNWMQTIFTNPLLDETLKNPVNQKARHLQLDLQKQKTKETIKGLSKEYGLFFFFSSKCAYCHEFAPIVKNFSEIHEWEVLAISLDGGQSDVFKNSVPDNGLFEQWNVQVLPALFAVNPTTGHVIPVAYGLTSIDEMENRIMQLVENKEEPK